VVDQFKELADAYTKETGVPVTVETATTDNYDSTLSSELGKSNAPTMFNVSGYPTFAKVKNYLEPLQNSAIYKLLDDQGKSVTMNESGKPYTVPFVAEYNGIIYNKKIIKTYASKSYALIKSADDIKDFDTLKAVTEDLQKHKDDLGLDGAWASPGLDFSGSYRYGDHMARIPVSAEFRDENTTFKPEITGKYIPEFKNMFDLQVNNNPEEASMLGSLSLDDVTSQFSLGKVAFFNCGTWMYAQIKGNDVANSDIGFLPFYMGIPGEENYSVVAILENQWGVNKNASAKDKKATLAFMKWMVSSKEGMKVMTKEMGFALPYTSAGDSNQPDNPLAIAAAKYAKEGKKYIYNVNVPDQQYKDNINNALTEYVQGTGKWDKVQSAFVDGWKTEWANSEKALGSLPEAQSLE
jgi:raffinose/stachyose/melibiose transport system substrate-binding protein